jgi:signal transduction histidine kinase
MLDEMERLLDQLRSVGDNIAHDLRAPLSIARAKTARALDEGLAGEPLRECLTSAVEHLDRASIIITALLHMSSVENGMRDGRFQDFDLAEACRRAFEFYEPLAQTRMITLTVAASGPTPVRGDKDLMGEAISNLVDNAIKFTPPGGRVEIAAGTDSRGPYVAVADNGPGVPEGERDNIFRRFYRIDQSGPPGNGLGLSIAMMIARLHGFSLTVADNHPGARFTLRGTDMAARLRGSAAAAPAPSSKSSDAPTHTAA